MIRATVDRVAGLEGVQTPIIVTSIAHATAIEREMAAAGFEEASIILEPMGRNTAPAVAVAAHEAMRANADPLLLILPSDHTISDRDVFSNAVALASRAAEDGHLLTFGITPNRPETGYGYVKLGDQIASGTFNVAEFREKPDLDTAEGYLADGGYLWNSGMFLMRASVYLVELARHSAAMALLSEQAWRSGIRNGHRLTLDTTAFEAIEGDSIDYAVMERTDVAAVVPTDPGWNDVGSWASLWDIAAKDDRGNAISGDVVSTATTNSYVRGTDRLIAVVGLDEVIVVDTPDAVLVASTDHAQAVKAIVDMLAETGRPELETDGVTRHTWGVERQVARGPGYLVRHFSLDLGAQTPIHTDRDTTTRWFVLKGSAQAEVGAESVIVEEAGSVSTKPGISATILNIGDSELELIAVTVGVSLEDDDSEEFLARYGKVEREV